MPEHRDLVSADDFLGQAELPFEELDGLSAAPTPRTLALYAHQGAQREAAGSVRLAIWLGGGGGGSSGGGDEGEGGSCGLSTLVFPPGTVRTAPIVVHSSAGSVYEEPLMACLAVSLDDVTGMHVPSGGVPLSAAGSRPLGRSVSDISRASSETGGDSAMQRRRGLGSLRSLFGGQRSRTAAQDAEQQNSAPGEDPGDDFSQFDFIPENTLVRASGRGKEASTRAGPGS